ncbi:MAG: catalase [Aquihabitans sp.]
MANIPSPKAKSKRKPAAKSERPASESAGGETHQVAGSGGVLTTQQGVPVSDDQNTLTDGERGPQLLEDFVMREKIFHFDHERIPERVVHARGYGVKGYFETYESLSDLTSADIFQRAGERTEVFARLSTVAGSAGSMDLARDVRGFAVKFYTREGNWDLVGNNMPVFFIQDAMKFPDLVHAVKAEPDRAFPQAQSAHDTFWDFISLMPESMHMVMWIMSDRAIPRSLRFMEGFGVHTFRFIDAAGSSTYVKFHWKPVLGTQSVLWDEAVKINGADPDFHRRDMWNTIDQGHPVEWELGVQIFDDDFADAFEFDVLDATKLIPEEIIPVRPVGRMVLNQNVDNFFAETEQVAFCTANVVRGIDFTNDPLLQGRNFSYLDTQLKRLGSPNFAHIPVNAPRCPVANFQRDGHMTVTPPPKGRANYEPNSWSDGGPREDPERGFTSFPQATEGDKRRTRPESFADHFSQARQFFASQQPVEQQHIIDALVFELSKVKTQAIQKRMVGQLRNVDDGLAAAVSDGLGFKELPDRIQPAVAAVDLDSSPALSMLANPPGTFAGRRFGALVCDGADAKAIRALRRAVKNHQASLALIAPSIHGISDSDGNPLEIDEFIQGGPSVLFDAVAIILTADGAAALANEPSARDFVTDAHVHAKFVGMGPNAATLLDAAGVDESMRDDGYLSLQPTNKSADALLDSCRDLRFWARV